ncbi:FAD:protein FMN transferase [Haematobacter missouriensis]|uniref:FAD:protein FMN transferase n=1 Tax=Haematobacter missouriensis TaxID=366616 RepID=A0ABX3ZQD7_9RHOB|nr:FAD:protein FMN transferase [Haematobacter missouriensis]OWJ73357.1 thiamine biosynthesis protein [Haematobacter missouriensis]
MMISGSETMRLTRRSVFLGLAAVAGLPQMAQAGEASRLSGRAFGTGWTALAEGLRDPERVAQRIRATLEAVDAEMSPFRPDSALSRFNAGGQDLPVSSDFEHVTRAALMVAAASGGACDPSVGPAVHRFGFGPIQGTYQPGGWQAIRCAEGRLWSEGPVTLDLCGIAKGFAVDRLAAVLGEESPSFIVEIGGEIFAQGDWPVGIADPLAGGVRSRIRLRDAAVATTGDAVNGFSHGGRRWSHVIDPATGAPVANDIASVSVIAPTAMQADALATALMVMGEERGLAFAAEQRVGALFLIRDSGGLRVRHNTVFAAHII